MEDEVIACIEDLVAENSNDPDKLSRELENLQNTYSKETLIKALEYNYVFGDSKLSEILKKFFEGSTVPLDNAYIKSLDFCECEVCNSIEKTEQLTAAEDIFKTTMIEPVFLTDSANYKHELINNFKYFKTLLTGDEIGDSLSIDEICSPTVISLISKINNEPIDETLTTKELLEKANKAIDFCQSNRAKLLFGSNDFSLMQRIRTNRGVSYLSRLLHRKASQANDKNSKFQKPKGMSINEDLETTLKKNPKVESGDFDKDNKVDIARTLQLNEGSTRDKGIPGKGKTVTHISSKIGKPDDSFNTIPTGDKAQKRNGSSAPGSYL